MEDEKLGTLYTHRVFPRKMFYIHHPKYDMGVFIIINQSGEITAKDMREVLNEIF